MDRCSQIWFDLWRHLRLSINRWRKRMTGRQRSSEVAVNRMTEDHQRNAQKKNENNKRQMAAQIESMAGRLKGWAATQSVRSISSDGSWWWVVASIRQLARPWRYVGWWQEANSSWALILTEQERHISQQGGRGRGGVVFFPLVQPPTRYGMGSNKKMDEINQSTIQEGPIMRQERSQPRR